MTKTLSVEAKTVGQKGSDAPIWELEIIDPDEIILLKDLITSIVREEVKSFNQKNHPNRLSPVLFLQNIEDGLASGKIGLPNAKIPEVGFEKAVKDAISAFSSGYYYVFVDGDRINSLEDGIFLGEHSKITFIRLTPLVGG